MRYFVIFLFLVSCYHRPSNEIEGIAVDVLKAKQGIEIDVKPLPKDVTK